MSRVSEVTLVAVDMQMRFQASWNVLDEVINEVAIAANEGASCIVLNYLDCGPCLAGITHAIKKHKMQSKEVHKNTSSGAAEVKEACELFNLSTKVFRVVGVNLHGCVEATVLELLVLFPECIVEVVMDGCSDQYGVNWASFPVHPRIRLISRTHQQVHANSNLAAA